MYFLIHVFAAVLLWYQVETPQPVDTSFVVDQPELQADTMTGQAQSATITNSEAFFGSPHNLPVHKAPQPILLKQVDSRDWMLWVLLAGFLVLAVAWFNFTAPFKRSLKAVLGLHFFFQVDKEGGFFRETHNYLLFLNFLIVLSVLIYQSLAHANLLDLWAHLNPEYVYGMIFFMILAFYVLKLAFVRFLAWVFHTQRATTIYMENIFVFNQFTGVILLLLVFHNAFNPSPEMLYVMWALVVGANIYKVIRGSVIAHNTSGFSMYYLFLYLCGVELMPLLIVWKAVTSFIPVL